MGSEASNEDSDEDDYDEEDLHHDYLDEDEDEDEHFKEALDSFLSKVPDEPKTDGLTPGATDLISGRATNSLEYQCARRREAWDSSDFDFGQGH